MCAWSVSSSPNLFSEYFTSILQDECPVKPCAKKSNCVFSSHNTFSNSHLS